FSADKAQNAAVPVVQRGFATQSGGKKTSQMYTLFRNASLLKKENRYREGGTYGGGRRTAKI
ncbi:MAG: hypothetical protein LBS85_06890, partial [Clostridiales Family XIII bacterium]|nr:hypothetical protein [Clostridiales Family XIII bacterium]